MVCNRLISVGLFVLLLSGVFAPIAFCDPNNGDFELYDYNETTSYNDPVGWQTENYVTVTQLFIPNPSQGSTTNWSISTTVGLNPFKGDSCIMLSSGNSDIQYGKAWQRITIGEGDKLTGVYFFGACDYDPYNDWAEITLVPINNPEANDINIAYADIANLGDYGSFGNWKRFERTFSVAEAGDYNLVLFVSDYKDYQLESYLAVDGLTLCRNQEGNPPPEKADFNCDCKVTFDDFVKIANDWQYNCNNPIYYNDSQGQPLYYDPNCNCMLGTDLDNSGLVDINDIGIFMKNWLAGIKEED